VACRRRRYGHRGRAWCLQFAGTCSASDRFSGGEAGRDSCRHADRDVNRHSYGHADVDADRYSRRHADRDADAYPDFDADRDAAPTHLYPYS
jgi:hypothetical protein